MSSTVASKFAFSLPQTEVTCGKVTIRTDEELILTLHCMFCELAYAKTELLRNHLLQVHCVEIVGTRELNVPQFTSEESCCSEIEEAECLGIESVVIKEELEEFITEDYEEDLALINYGGDNDVSKNSDFNMTINEECSHSSTEECPVQMEENEGDDLQDYENEHLNISANRLNAHSMLICLHCNRDDFRTQSSYRDHFAEVHPHETPPENVLKSKPYKCTLCDAWYKTDTDLIIHIQSAHSKADVSAPAPTPDPPPTTDTFDEHTEYDCEFCYHVPFVSQMDLKLHIDEKHFGIPKAIPPSDNINRIFKCCDCKEAFSTRYILMKHIEKEHQMKLVDTSKSRICEYCGKIFKQIRKLRFHRKTIHTQASKYKCDLCESAYNLKARLELHVNSVHRKEPTHICDICSAGFYAKRYLNRHKVQRHKIKQPLQCQQCDAAYFAEYALRNHTQKYHT